ncbi:MAG: phosphatase domain-containing protein [Candidatus Binatia bacterium]
MTRTESTAGRTLAVFRWDLDKTYLRTEFESLRDLIRVPFQSAADKIDVPGVVELIRALKQCAEAEHREVRTYFLSASPPQIARAIREKFQLDGIEIDGIIFKNQLQILMRGRFRSLREQTGFKLTELLRGRVDMPPHSVEYLFGDDWETDPIIYSIYADVLAGRLDSDGLSRILETIPVDREWRQQIDMLVPQLSHADAVRRIFINLERRTPPGFFHAFGPRVVPTFNYFQTAACLFEEGVIDVDAVERVGRALVSRESYSREMLENSLGDVCRRGHLGTRARDALSEELRRRNLFARRKLRLRQRLRDWWVRRRRRSVPDAKPRGEPLDYAAIVSGWRPER